MPVTTTSLRQEQAKPSAITKETVERLYAVHVDTVYRVCLSMLGSRQDAEDAVQTVFLKLIRANPAFAGEQHEKAWLIRTAQNHCRDCYRQWWRRRVVLMVGPEQAVKDGTMDVLDALWRLAPKYRLVLYLHYYEGYKVDEIAGLLELSPNTVKTRMRIGRKRMKIDLEGDLHE